jgi:hypothetical protein
VVIAYGLEYLPTNTAKPVDTDPYWHGISSLIDSQSGYQLGRHGSCSVTVSLAYSNDKRPAPTSGAGLLESS